MALAWQPTAHDHGVLGVHLVADAARGRHGRAEGAGVGEVERQILFVPRLDVERRAHVKA